MLSSWPVAFWKRRLNCSSFASPSRCSSSVSLSSRSSAACDAMAHALVLAHHEAGLDRELVHREPHRLAGGGLGHTRELEHHASGLHDRDPVLGVALARAHAGLGRLLGDGLVREDVDPHLPATLDVAGHRDTGGFDLAVGDPPGLERLDPVVAEGHPRAALRRCRSSGLAASCGGGPSAASTSSRQSSSSPWNFGASWCWRVRRSISSSSARSRSSSGSASLTSGVASSGELVAPSPSTGVASRRRAATAATGADDPALRALARRLADGHRGFLAGSCPRPPTCTGGSRPCRSRPSRRCDRTWSGPRPGRSRCRRAACAAAPDPRGTTPCGDISAPPRRPLHCTRMPWAPAFIAVCTARFIARRKRDAAGELVGDALRDERGVELGLLDLLDVEVDLRVAGDLEQPGAQAVGLGAAAADDDARDARCRRRRAGGHACARSRPGSTAARSSWLFR